MTTRNFFFFSRGKKRKKLETGTDWVPRTDGQKQRRAAVRLGGEQYYHCELLVQEKQRVKQKKWKKGNALSMCGGKGRSHVCQNKKPLSRKGLREMKKSPRTHCTAPKSRRDRSFCCWATVGKETNFKILPDFFLTERVGCMNHCA